MRATASAIGSVLRNACSASATQTSEYLFQFSLMGKRRPPFSRTSRKTSLYFGSMPGYLTNVSENATDFRTGMRRPSSVPRDCAFWSHIYVTTDQAASCCLESLVMLWNAPTSGVNEPALPAGIGAVPHLKSLMVEYRGTTQRPAVIMARFLLANCGPDQPSS